MVMLSVDEHRRARRRDASCSETYPFRIGIGKSNVRRKPKIPKTEGRQSESEGSSGVTRLRCARCRVALGLRKHVCTVLDNPWAHQARCARCVWPLLLSWRLDREGGGRPEPPRAGTPGSILRGHQRWLSDFQNVFVRCLLAFGRSRLGVL